MKKVGKIMEEMGFNKNASDSVKKAFIKHLIKNAFGVEVQDDEKSEKEKNAKHNVKFDQLEFDFIDFEIESENKNKKAV